MEWEILFSLGVVVFCFGMLAFTRVSPDIITTAGLSLILITGILTPQEALAGFSNEGMLTVAVLYVVVSGLTETGAVGWGNCQPIAAGPWPELGLDDESWM